MVTKQYEMQPIMKSRNNTQSLLSGFQYKATEPILFKIKSIISDGPDKLFLLLDFDRTLTTGKLERGGAATTWQILYNRLSKKASKKYTELFLRYRQLEVESRMTTKDAQTWWEESLCIFIEDRVHIRDVEFDFINQTKVRSKTESLFTLCHKYGIPTIILSAGLAEIIEIWSHTYHITPTKILATKLHVDTQGIVTGWDNDSLIHTLNKREKSDSHISEIRKNRPNCIVIGDNLEDADMIEGTDRVLRIRILDPRSDEMNQKRDVVRETFSRFDLILNKGTLAPVVTLLNCFSQTR